MSLSSQNCADRNIYSMNSVDILVTHLKKNSLKSVTPLLSKINFRFITVMNVISINHTGKWSSLVAWDGPLICCRGQKEV